MCSSAELEKTIMSSEFTTQVFHLTSVQSMSRARSNMAEALDSRKWTHTERKVRSWQVMAVLSRSSKAT